MTPAELRAARLALGQQGGLGRELTYHELAALLRMGKWGWQSVGKWQRGETAIPGTVELAIELLLERDGYISIGRLK